MRILVIDDHISIHRGLRALLLPYPSLEIINSATTGAQGLRLIKETRPDLVILDMQLPDMSGIQVLESLRQSGDTTPVLILSAHSDPFFVLGALRSGANGYILKEEAPGLIYQAIQTADQQGDPWISPHLRPLLPKVEKTGAQVYLFAPLSKQEKQILEKLIQGWDSPKIARSLRISEKTVENYIEAILRKLHVRDSREASAVARRLELV